MSIHDQIEMLQTAHDHLDRFVGILDQIRELLQPFQTALEAPPSRAALEQMGVTLTFHGGSLTDDSWTVDRIKEAHSAVMRIIQQIANESGENPLFALVLFVEVFGGTTIQLTWGSDPSNGKAYASTQGVSENSLESGRIIYLYTQPTALLPEDEERCAEELGIPSDQATAEYCGDHGFILVHTAENIVHEFGHVLLNRYGGSDSEIYQEWQQMWLMIIPFDTQLGWTEEDFDDLQNRSTIANVVSGAMTDFELENERIPNMFESWVFDRTPDINAEEQRQLRAAWAMWLYMTGTVPPDDVRIRRFADIDEQPCRDDEQPCPEGFLQWLLELGGQADEPED